METSKIITNFILIINLFILTESYNFCSYGSKIELKVKGIGNNSIFGKYFEFIDNEYIKVLYINGKRQETIEYIYSFN